MIAENGNPQVIEYTMPTIGVIICTADRGAEVCHTVSSALACGEGSAQVLVVDQSRDNRTQLALASFANDNRVRVAQLVQRGKCLALNHGLALVDWDIALSTDDDCILKHGCLEALALAFRNHPNAAVAFGNVIQGEHNPSEGFVPAYVQGHDSEYRSVKDFCAPHGVGACMALRRETVLKLGGMAAEFGPGGRFPAYEDGEMALRAILSGYSVLHVAGAQVVHNGFRTWAEGRELARRDWLGIGAGQAILLKRFGSTVLPVIRYDLWNYVVKPAALSLARLKRPSTLTRGMAWVRGYRAGRAHFKA